ncbi:MAG: hypothetical protein K6B74_10765 [Ruminococcus sp.]|nr:hypothetical protein [Ruminococcus sp.]
MTGKTITSFVSAEDKKYAKKKILCHSPVIWFNVIILAFAVTAILLYLRSAVYPLFTGEKMNYYRLFLAVIAAVFIVIKLIQLLIILCKKTCDLLTDITFGEKYISGTYIAGKTHSQYSYTSMERLYIFPKTVVITGSGGGLYITRSDIPDPELLRSFLLEKNPNLKVKEMK